MYLCTGGFNKSIETMKSKKVTPEIRRAGIKTIEQDISKRAGIKQSSRSQADEHDQSRRAGTKQMSRNKAVDQEPSRRA